MSPEPADATAQPDRRQQAALVAATDPDASATRREVVTRLTDSFLSCGRVVRTCGAIVGNDRVSGVSPFQNGSDAVVALGYLAEAAHELLDAAATCLTGGNRYAAAALTRQLVEVEYLLWAFAEDQQEAAGWLRSTEQERKRYWQPRHIRDRSDGRFRGTDYSSHCELGGHPTPRGLRTLLNDSEAPLVEVSWAELANHGSSAWRYFVAAVDEARLTEVLTGHEIDDVDRAIEYWRAADSDLIALAARDRPTAS